MNNDGIDDIFLFGNQQKNFVVHKGLEKGEYSPPIKKFFFFPIDDIKWLTKSKRGDDYYVFVSRNKRIAGLVSFTKSYSLQLLNTINFNSYPSSIEITDLDSNGINEALIYGNNFDGIIVLQNDGYKLVSDTLYKQSVFSNVSELDFNQDEVNDLVVLDALNNSISFLENSEIGGFYSTREIEYEKSLHSLNIIDIDGDTFDDLLLISNGEMEILLGDSVFSYEQKLKLNIKFNLGKSVICDLNLDNKKDLVSINSIDNETLIFFDFFSPDNYINLPLEGITDLKIKNINSGDVLFLLSKKGKVQVISNKSKWGEDFNLVIGGYPGSIQNLIRQKPLNSVIISSDSESNKIKLINLTQNGIFKSIKTLLFSNDLVRYSFSDNFSIIARYSPKKRLLEILDLKGDSEEYNNSKYLYTKYPINQMLIDGSNNFQIIGYDREVLFRENIKAEDGNYTAQQIVKIDSAVITSFISNNGDIYFWSNVKEYDYLFNKYNDGNTKELYRISNEDSVDFKAVILPDQSNASNKILTIINGGIKQSVIIIDKEKVFTYDTDYDFLQNYQFSHNLKFYSKFFESGALFEYKRELKQLKQFKFNKKNKKIDPGNNIDEINLNDYFLSQYFSYNYLIYSNKENNSITFKVLDK